MRDGGGGVWVHSPATGVLVPLEGVADPVFAGRLLGDGVAVRPWDGTLAAPVDGVVSQVGPASHALCIEGACGLSVMVHAGIDTADLAGEGFRALVAPGDAVAAGDPVLLMDVAAVVGAGLDPTVVCVVLAPPPPCLGELRAPGPVAAGEAVARVVA